MGEAKRRGTFEERKQLSIARNEIDAKERYKRYLERQKQNDLTLQEGRLPIATAIALSGVSLID